MSDKNEISKSKKESSGKKEENNIKIFDIKSQFARKNIFDFLSNGIFREQTNGILKYNSQLYKNGITLPLRQEQRIDSLSDVSKWTPYLKYIYRSLSEIANKLYDYVVMYPKYSQKIIGEQECIESIVQLLAVRLIFYNTCIKKTKLFDSEDLKLIKLKQDLKLIKEKAVVEQLKQEVVFKQIDNSIKKAFGFKDNPDYAYNEKKIKDLAIYDTIKDCIEQSRNNIGYGMGMHGDYGGNEKAVVKYIEDILPKNDNKRQEFRNNVQSVLIQFMCLNDENRCYAQKIDRLPFREVDVMRKRRKQFNERIISALDLKDEDYKIFAQNMVKNPNLYSFVLGQDDYDIRNYPDSKLFDAIKNALPTQEQKGKFQTFIEDKNKLKKDLKTEEPKPNCEKEDSKDI